MRHGQTNSNVNFLLDTAEPGAELDASGLEQAARLVERLSQHEIEAVYASTLVRTQQTARPLAEHRGLELQVLPGLREIPAGEYEMSPQYEPYGSALMAWGAGDLEARVPGGENAHEFFARYDAAIAEIAQTGRQVVMVVSHGAALRVWASRRIDGFNDAVRDAHLDNTSVIVADGSPEEGWKLAGLDGLMYYPEQQ